MKRLLSIPFLLSFAAVTGCSLNDNPIEDTVHNTITVELQNYGSKVVLTDEYFGDKKFEAGDAISVFNSNVSEPGGFKAITEKGGSVAEFNIDGMDTVTPYAGVWPYNESFTFESMSFSFGLILPDIQLAHEMVEDVGKHIDAVYAGVSQPGSDKIPFYNMTTGIRFTVSESGYHKIVFRGNSGELISGPFTATFSSEGIDISVDKEAGATTVTLVSESGFIPTTDRANAYFYYLNMLPVVFSNGFEFEFYKDADAPETANADASTSTDIYKEMYRGLFGTIYSADNQESVSRITGGIDLSNHHIDLANCYIVTSPGKYFLPLRRGNDDDDVIVNSSGAEIVWETNNTGAPAKENSIVDSPYVSGDNLYFTVPQPFTNGNALIAVSNASGDILWSWHIWACENYDAEESAQTVGTAVFMDRNLGALQPVKGEYGLGTSRGLFYQWGRKDPFVGSPFNKSVYITNGKQEFVQRDATNGSLDYVISHPYIFIFDKESSCDWYNDVEGEHGPSSEELWRADRKTIYDPCPAGWIVPGKGLLPDQNDKVNLRYDISGVWFQNYQNVWIPASGCFSELTGVYGTATSGLWTGDTGVGGASRVYIMVLERSPLIKYDLRYRASGFNVRCVKE